MKDQDILPSRSESAGNEKKKEYEGPNISPHDDPHNASTVWHPVSKSAVTPGPDFWIEQNNTFVSLERLVLSYQVER
jgi:hypothetical protein